MRSHIRRPYPNKNDPNTHLQSVIKDLVAVKFSILLYFGQ